ncbi:MAG: hypothetical protein ACOYB3_18135, partial [Azonexus sp.]
MSGQGQIVALTPELLHQIIRSATEIPLQRLQEIHKQEMETQSQNIKEVLTAQTQLMERLHVSSHTDPLRKLKEKDPQFPAFTGNSDHFLPWILECQVRKESRQLPDDVAVQYAIIALGEHSVGLLPKDATFTGWNDFVTHLRSKLLRHTADWQLIAETGKWRMNGDWPRLHSIVQTYRMFTPKEAEYTLMLNLIAALDPYIQRKVIKDPKPNTLDEVIARTWDAHRTALPVPPPAPVAQQTQGVQPMQLDMLRHTPSPSTSTSQTTYNAFSGKPMLQTFGGPQ